MKHRKIGDVEMIIWLWSFVPTATASHIKKHHTVSLSQLLLHIIEMRVTDM